MAMELVGRPIELVASDPWDFVDADGSARFAGVVTSAWTFDMGADEERLLIKLTSPVQWHGATYQTFLARHRHGHGLADDVRQGRAVECSLIAVIAGELPESLDGFSSWRGGLGVRATINS